jgi:hypothetical protein
MLATGCAMTATAHAVEPPDLRRLLLATPAAAAPHFDLGWASLQSQESAGDGGTSAGFASRKRYIAPVLLSAAIPGAGEIATGHWWRGLPLLAADVATWFGHAHYKEEGRAWRDRYQAFADAHWHLSGDTNGNGVIDAGSEISGWQENLEQYYDAGQPDPDLRWWDPAAPYECTCPFIPRDEDPQHYYENIGKYRYYWMGWEDWSYNPDDPRNSDSAAYRAQYNGMRIESNDNFDRARALVAVAMANRALSVAQSIFLVRRDGRGRESMSLRPMKVRGMGAGLELRWKY